MARWADERLHDGSGTKWYNAAFVAAAHTWRRSDEAPNSFGFDHFCLACTDDFCENSTGVGGTVMIFIFKFRHLSGYMNIFFCL